MNFRWEQVVMIAMFAWEATSTSEKETSEKKRQERDADIDMAKVDKLLSKSS